MRDGDGYGTQEDGTLAIPGGQTIRFNGPQADGAFDVTFEDGQLRINYHGMKQLAVIPVAGNSFRLVPDWKAVR